MLYFALFWIPISGLSLLFLSGEERDIAENNEWQAPYDLIGDDAALLAHVAGHFVFFAAVFFHVGLALRRRTVTRML